MRLLLVSDIHSNLEALQACLAAAPEYDLVVNLGDIVGYGGSPNEVVQQSRNVGKLFVRGNHDKVVSGMAEMKDFNPAAGIAALWTRDVLSAENMQWLCSLPSGPVQVEELPGVQFVHGSPLGEDEYVVSIRDAVPPLLSTPADLTFFGHTHIQGVFLADENEEVAEFCAPEYETVGQAERWEYRLKEGIRYMVNPGSVGQPRDADWRAAFALFDSEVRNVIFCRTPYDLKTAQERVLAANLPARLATRLAAGR